MITINKFSTSDTPAKYAGCFLTKESVNKIKNEFPEFKIKDESALVLEDFEKLREEYGESDAELFQFFENDYIGKEVTLLIDKVSIKDNKTVYLHIHDMSFNTDIGIYDHTELKSLLREEPIINASDDTLPVDDNIAWEDKLILVETVIGTYSE